MNEETKRLRDFKIIYEYIISLNETILKMFPKIPLLANSNVVYDQNPTIEGRSTILDVISRGRGDVEDLAAWRAAELRAQGEKATIAMRGVHDRWLTCVVIRDDGSEEDVTKLVKHYQDKVLSNEAT